MKLTIWHHNACSTSRKALDYLTALGCDLAIRNYIAHPPTEQELQDVLKKMNAKAEDILRKKDKVFQEKFAKLTLSESEWVRAMHQNPSIIERPIVLSDTKAWLARPFDAWVENFANTLK